eukprot:5888058-Alexandrium_andersonii.AAC.1
MAALVGAETQHHATQCLHEAVSSCGTSALNRGPLCPHTSQSRLACQLGLQRKGLSRHGSD